MEAGKRLKTITFNSLTESFPSGDFIIFIPCILWQSVELKPQLADNFKKYKTKQIPKNNILWTQNSS